MVQWWSTKRANASYPLRTGVRITAGTDAPVVPSDPFASLWWMVTRDTQFAEDEGGSFEVGKRADMVSRHAPAPQSARTADPLSPASWIEAVGQHVVVTW